MTSLRRVEGDAAGPVALGVLLPPGRLTYLILRPRALPFDLILLKNAEETTFRDLTRAEGERAARTFYTALESWYTGGSGSVEAVPCGGLGFVVRAVVGALPFLVCPREPGKPYRPQVFTDAADAEVVAIRLAAALRPPTGSGLEVYFNTRHFER